MVSPDIWVPVKVLPGKEALEYFVQHWKEAGSVPFNGEFETPPTEDPRRLLTTSIDYVSHCVTDIDMNTYDESKRTVMMKCRFCGPYGPQAMENYINKDLRFCARVVEGVDAKTRDHVQRIVTFDCINRPPKSRKDMISDILNQRGIEADEAAKRKRDKKG